MRAERAALRIGEVARRTGVGVATLRAWERRYDLIEPTRTEGGHRLYSDDDVRRVRAVQDLVDAGWAVGAAAAEVRGGAVGPGVPAAGGGADQLRDRLQSALDRFDETAVEAALDDVFARLDTPAALDEVVLPALRWVGAGWETDDRVIAREHLATNVLRPRLQRILRTTPSLADRAVVGAAPEHEEHDLGLLAACVVAAVAGWRVHFLGARTPVRVLERAVQELRPAVVLIGALDREHAGDVLRRPPALEGTPVVLGGPGFRADDEAAVPLAVVHDGPIRDVLESIRRARALAAG